MLNNKKILKNTFYYQQILVILVTKSKIEIKGNQNKKLTQSKGGLSKCTVFLGNLIGLDIISLFKLYVLLGKTCCRIVTLYLTVKLKNEESIF